MLNEKLIDVISHEGVVSSVTCNNNNAHVVLGTHMLMPLRMVDYYCLLLIICLRAL